MRDLRLKDWEAETLRKIWELEDKQTRYDCLTNTKYNSPYNDTNRFINLLCEIHNYTRDNSKSELFILDTVEKIMYIPSSKKKERSTYDFEILNEFVEFVKFIHLKYERRNW